MRVLLMLVLALLLSAPTAAGTLSRVSLSAEGYGKDVISAREAALQELSQRVLSNIRSDMESITRLEGAEITDSIQNRLSIESRSYFQGVVYSEPRSVAGSLLVSASLDAAAIQQTAEHLLREIQVDLGTLSRHEILTLQDKAVFLMAFSAYLPSNTASTSIQQADQQRQLAYRYLNFAQVIFEVQPADSRIQLGELDLRSGVMQLIPPGHYRYQASATGFHNQHGQVFLSAGERRRIPVSLVPERHGSVAVQLINSTDQNLSKEAQRVFGSFNIQYAATSPQVIQLEVQQDFVTEISGIKIYNLQLVAEARKNNQVVLVRRASQKNVIEAQVDSRLLAITRALIHAILTAPEAEQLWQ